jgi:hypothetical protein
MSEICRPLGKLMRKKDKCVFTMVENEIYPLWFNLKYAGTMSYPKRIFYGKGSKLAVIYHI